MSEGFAPRSLEEALAVRAERPDAVPVAGGTDLMVAVNAVPFDAPLLDLSRVGETTTWERRNGAVFVGAGVTFARIARELHSYPPLADAARSIGSPQIRNRATIGGNVATASPAGDSIPVLAAYDADVVVASIAGERRIPWRSFFVGPKRTTLAADQLVVGVEWTVVAGPGIFAKVGTRNAMVIAVASAALQLDPASRAVRLALGSAAPTVVRAREAEEHAAAAIAWDDPEQPLREDALLEFGRLAAASVDPIDDVRGSAAYRRHAVAVLARRALVRAVDDWRDGRW